MTGAPSVRLPSGPITPQGAYHLLKGKIPMLWLDAPDGSIRIDFMGGLSMIDRTRPESVHIKKDGLKGLIGPWKQVKQKGATQDGITFIDALGDPLEVQITAMARGRDAKHLRQVIRYLTGSVDPKRTSRLNFFTQEMGHWWADVRWMKTLPGPMSGAQQRKQQVDLMLESDGTGCWESDPDSSTFSFVYDDVVDLFDVEHVDDAGPNWPLHYYDGTGGGHPRVERGYLTWVDDPDHLILTSGLSVAMGPFKDFSTVTNNQVVSMTLGWFQEITFPDGAENHLWARMGRNVDGTWNGNGVRASIGPFSVELSRFNNFVETPMMQWFNLPSLPGESYTLVAGFVDNPRHFQIQRNGLPIWDHVEAATGLSVINSTHRGIGIGMRAGGAIITQATPAALLSIGAGDNATVTQSGFLERVNVGDQGMYDDFTIFGPASKVKIWNGPDSDDWVEIGPLLPNQVMFVRSDPRDRQVQDLTSVPPTPQELTQFQQASNAFLDLIGVGGTPLAQQIESFFGVTPPQGPTYSLLKGRFSDAAAIPPKSPGEPVRPYHVKVSIEGGNASSTIIAAGTPRRRLPW
jgi:hypothetical protein